MYRELELQIDNLKTDFRDGLEKFQFQVSNQLQSGIKAANDQFNGSMPNLKQIETQINNRSLEQQRYLNASTARSKQAIKRLENQLNSLRWYVIFTSIVLIMMVVVYLY
ncbi:hypothetical protein IQ255_25270 [Pleurocapsales cyanobacterium LEGE 10410]|nr:hypothetical protein [Pleurocapsales cyanobacterium LEGE 10410]